MSKRSIWTKEKVEDLRRSQRGKCAICRTDISGRNEHLDHCHATGRIRGLLCRACNIGLGCFQDDCERMLSAIKYLNHRFLDYRVAEMVYDGDVELTWS